ncbi:hypothetical protein PGB90_007330 [Kerria lacca]
MWKELHGSGSSKYRSVELIHPEEHFLDSSAHTGGYYCPNGCGRKYKYKGNLSQHLKNECGKEKQFECEFCNKRFTHKIWFSVPGINKHEHFACPNENCERKYKRKNGLLQHLKYECGMEPQFRCEVFTSVFISRQKADPEFSNVGNVIVCIDIEVACRSTLTTNVVKALSFSAKFALNIILKDNR